MNIYEWLVFYLFLFLILFQTTQQNKLSKNINYFFFKFIFNPNFTGLCTSLSIGKEWSSITGIFGIVLVSDEDCFSGDNSWETSGDVIGDDVAVDDDGLFDELFDELFDVNKLDI